VDNNTTHRWWTSTDICASGPVCWRHRETVDTAAAADDDDVDDDDESWWDWQRCRPPATLLELGMSPAALYPPSQSMAESHRGAATTEPLPLPLPRRRRWTARNARTSTRLLFSAAGHAGRMEKDSWRFHAGVPTDSGPIRRLWTSAPCPPTSTKTWRLADRASCPADDAEHGDDDDDDGDRVTSSFIGQDARRKSGKHASSSQVEVIASDHVTNGRCPRDIPWAGPARMSYQPTVALPRARRSATVNLITRRFDVVVVGVFRRVAPRGEKMLCICGDVCLSLLALCWRCDVLVYVADRRAGCGAVAWHYRPAAVGGGARNATHGSAPYTNSQ